MTNTITPILWLCLTASVAMNLYHVATEPEIEWLPSETANWLEAQDLIDRDIEDRYDSIAHSMGYRAIRYNFETPGRYNSDTLWTAYVVRPTYELGSVPELFHLTASNEDTTYQLAAQGLIDGLRVVELPGKDLKQ